MPGVNGICNTKMSHQAAYFELFLRCGALLRKIHNSAQRGACDLPTWASEVARRIRYVAGLKGGMVLPQGDSG